MVFINSTDILGIIIFRGTEASTGSLFISLLAVMFILMVFCMGFNIDIDWSVIILFPYVVVCASYYSDWVAPLGVFILYISATLTRRFFIK